MNRLARATILGCSFAVVTIWGFVEAPRGDDSELRDIPPALAPLEYLVGKWKGTGVPKDDPAKRFRGWIETHSWAWVFAGGKPAALSVTIEGGRFLASGKLIYDQARKRYRLEGTEPKPSARPIAFEGALDGSGKLVLERVAAAGASRKDPGKMRVTLWPNANFIRYTMTDDRQGPEAFQYKRMIEIGLTKEGESFAAGAAAAERPKCIVTGGAATLTVSFQGQTIPLCCTGCRDEFNGDPEKYLKKAALMLGQQAGKTKGSQPTPARVSRREDAFAADVVDSEQTQTPPRTQKNESTKSTEKAGKTAASADSAAPLEKPQSKSATNKSAAKSAASKPATRAATLLRLGRNLEKSGKTSAALTYFRQIVKDYPDTPAAKTAAERIKDLEKE
jgi:hypothetical protein